MNLINMGLFYLLGVLVLGCLSYGFLDVHISLTDIQPIAQTLETFRVYSSIHRPFITLVWMFGLLAICIWYISCMRQVGQWTNKSSKLFVWLIVGSAIVFTLSYPATSYDIFNYITTAKVSFFYKENPYVIMPIELIGEPYLSFTRAANKLALYGPVWILLTAIPHYLGFGTIWATIITFKLLNAVFYLFFLYFIYRVTNSMKNVLFFAFNPLILLEVLVSGHNDIVMMVLALTGMYLWWHTQRGIGFFLFALSWFIKGLTMVLLPMFFMKKKTWDDILHLSYWVVLFVFFIAAPLREELYPWYAVWFISIAALMKFQTYPFIYWLTIVLSISLELRHLPYMWMGYYEGLGPILRFALTAIPVSVFLVFYTIVTYKKPRTPR